MENKYRESLRKAKENHGQNHPLYQTSYGYLDGVEHSLEGQSGSVISLKKSIIQKEVKSPVTSEVTEKTIILDSLNVFGDEKLKDSDSYKFSGGEISKKSENSKSSRSEITKLDFTELENKLIESMGSEFYQRRFSTTSLNERKNLKVLFITENTNLTLEECDSHLEEMSVYFDKDVSNLLYRMIKAMRLENDQFAMASIQVKDQKNIDLVLSELLFLNPELIITLGAQATNDILNTKDRLKDIHGQIIKANFVDQNKENYQFNTMPLFSPKLLQTAPNMKKTAWKDMQAAMELLKL